MSEGKKANQHCCDVHLDANIANMPCAGESAGFNQSDSPESAEENIKTAIRLLSGFGITAQEAYSRFKNTKPEELYGL